ncbi:hypothetical protein C8J56DRAFT_457063 [Mycena floridula]|nr:hypothetical protein C8J56DRAFT_457063 [Mycena floridula]
MNTFANVPVEIIEKIILLTWEMPLTNRERTIFMSSSVLVSRTWLKAFMRISCTDVHIPSPKYPTQFFKLMGDASRLFCIDPEIIDFPRRIRSLNIRIDEGGQAMAKTLRQTLHNLCVQYIPVIPQVNILFNDHSFREPADLRLLSDLPPMAFIGLSVEYTFSTDQRRRLAGISGANLKRMEALPRDMGFVRHLSVLGTDKDRTLEIAALCYDLDTFTTDSAGLEKKAVPNLTRWRRGGKWLPHLHHTKFNNLANKGSSKN